jgi:nitrite reductase/ring-hydroxylating ferredoxin subunit
MFQRVLRADRLRKQEVVSARAGIRQVGVLKLEGRVLAFRATCPHAGAPLGGARVTGGMITCPRHGWAFRVADGVCPAHPLYALTAWPVEVRSDGWVWVDLPGEFED